MRKEVGLELCPESCIAFNRHLGCSSGGACVYEERGGFRAVLKAALHSIDTLVVHQVEHVCMRKEVGLELS